ncbi:hypothetical protein K0C01_05275 [Salinarchaeum sp. IM2453]|uniref:hypothetical protein n=1 Tax=Salinarchaeum sp. IM2453 TaxID=2862870 RepID=UPI001C82E9DA|nr:hypothetical protein [Salinarchaeum sp. IM2453]QZA89543.1 hypothetical protein K0C01_05275 [Salinarchaeum sp. IM2453]
MSLEPNEQFTAKITTITQNGKATVRRGNKTVNIGPVSCEKGERVRLKYLGEKEEFGNDVGFAICLNEEMLADNYDEWVHNMIDHLIMDQPPDQGEVTYSEIDEIRDRNLGRTTLGGKRIQLGPVEGDVGDLVRIVGAEENYAKVLTPYLQGKNYEVRFKILSGQFDELPISIGDKITTTISDIENNTLVGYVGDIPIWFPDADAEIAQKVDGQITGCDADHFIGEIVNTYDEPGRIEHSSHWARMQWLRQSGFADDPLHNFTQKFIHHDQINLPDATDRLRDALVAEAIRLAIADKVEESDGAYPRVHISGIQHWVTHKLAAILGNPKEEDSEDWFNMILKDRSGPTITFLGDILNLSEGYYAPSPTHAVMTNSSNAVLISGQPTMAFSDRDLEIQVRGITRIITGTSEGELLANDIPVQSRSEYVGLDSGRLFTESDLINFITDQPKENWTPEQSWEPYTGQQWGFQQDGDPLEVKLDDDSTVSFWRVPVEYGRDVYRLKLQRSASESTDMVAVPSRYRKHVSLIIDAVSGISQRVEFKKIKDGVLVSCDFVPPRHQMRWLHAIGAEWLETSKNQLQWRIQNEETESVVDIFESLPITITNKTKVDY